MKRLLLLLLLTISFFFAENCKAGIETSRNFTPSGTDIRVGTLVIQDDKLSVPGFDWNIVNTNYMKNNVYVRIVNPQLIKYIIHYEVALSIKYYTNRTLSSSTTVSTTLHVNYDPHAGVSYKAIDNYDFQGAYRIEVTVISVTNTDMVNDPNLPLALQLGGSIVADRTYSIAQNRSLNILGAKLTSVATLADPATEQLKLNWDFIPGQDEYDVEWTTVDEKSDFTSTVNSMLTAGSNFNVSPTDIEAIFRNNSTRVTMSAKDHEYVLSLAYNGNYVLVRMRYAYYTDEGVRVNGNWNYTCQQNSSSPFQYCIWPLSWNEPNLNWQYSAAFAEDGKKKEVISYFDGSLRNRQTVTMNNTDNVAVAQENVYDDFGRATASILPAPYYESQTTVKALHFIPKLNLAQATQKPYTIRDIFNSASGVECETPPGQMSRSVGAARYYSDQNDLLSNAIPQDQRRKYNAYIPDALNYPFSVTQYTNDNTGRIKLQGGVGPDLQPKTGGQSNTTKYFYGKPEQWELDQLFGNDVGYADHYLKNMVIDPNGQASITYINASGKTIATALTGTAPTSLDPLSNIGENIHTETTQLLKPGQFKFSGSDLKIKATTTYLLSAPAKREDVTFTYNLKQIIDTYPTALPPNVTSNCYYNVEISIVDNCGTVIGHVKTNQPIIPDNIPKTISLDHDMNIVGEYFITFELSLDKKMIEEAADTYIDNAKTKLILKKRYEYIKANFLQNIDLTGNYNDCKTCDMLLGTHDDFKAMVAKKFTEVNIDVLTTGTAETTDFDKWVDGYNDVDGPHDGLYTKLSKRCQGLSCDFQPCNAFHDQMIQDISPGGQYALFYANAAPIEPEVNVLTTHFNDVFKPAITPGTIPDEFVIHRADGSIITVYDAEFDKVAMVKYWNPLWAERFLQYHPEYCKLLFCQAMQDKENWDEKIKEVYTTADQIYKIGSNAAYRPDLAEWLVDYDPFFNTTGGSDYKTAMKTDLNNYSATILNIGNNVNGFNTLGLTQYIDYSIYRIGNEAPANGQPASNTIWNDPVMKPLNDPCRVKDKEWSMYKEFYFQLKQKYYEALRTRDYCNNLTCDIGKPLETPLPGSCPTPRSFSIASLGISNTTGKQIIQIDHTGAALDGPVTIHLYLPSTVTGVIKNKVLQPNEFPYTFEVPTDLPVSSIHVISTTCPADKLGLFGANKVVHVTESVVSDGYSPEYYEWLADDWFNPRSNGYYIHFVFPVQTKKTTITLTNEEGYEINAGQPITVKLNYNIHDNEVAWYVLGDTGGTQLATAYNTNHDPRSTEVQLVIPAGQSSASYTYASLGEDDGQPDYFPTYYQPEQILDCSDKYSGIDPGISAVLCSPPTPDEEVTTCLVYKYKESRFPVVKYNTTAVSGAQSGQLQGNNFDDLKSQVKSSCEKNAESWMQSLGIASGTNEALKARLIAVCEAGGDFKHSFGVSVLPAVAVAESPGQPAIPTLSIYGDHDFGAAISAYYPGPFSPTLNPWLIASPYAYDSPQQGTDITLTASSADICTLLNTYHGDYVNSIGGGAGTDAGFYSYLRTRFGNAMNVTLDDLSTLMKSCSCSYILNHDVTLPAFLNTNSQVNKTNYQAAKTTLLSQFNSATLLASDQYPTILTNYMNQHYGFAYSYQNYVDFENNTDPNAVLYNIPPYTNTTPDPYAPVESILGTALANGTVAYDKYISDARSAFLAHYIQTNSQVQPNLDLLIRTQNYHYTLYYYDQADNLVRTVPPEGVTFLSDIQVKQVQAARDGGDITACSNGYNGPSTEASAATAFNALANTVTNGGAIEMWLYNPIANAPSQIIQKTDDGRYLFQLSVNGGQLNVDIYSLSMGVNSATITASNHVTGNIANIGLLPWVHVLVQSSNFLTGVPDLYLNGQKLNLIPGAPPASTPWFITATSSGVTFTDNYATLKHLRLYNGLLTQGQITALAQNSCFTVQDPALISMLGTNWYRFHIPGAGTETTIAGNSTQETTLNSIYPAHGLATSYAYNSTDQVVTQNTPDAGETDFWYDMKSRLIASQNAKQAGVDHDTFSYTVYDKLGRIIEVGEKGVSNGFITPSHYVADDDVTVFYEDGSNTQITRTFYDDKPNSQYFPYLGTGAGVTGLYSLNQDNLRKRVSATTYQNNSYSTPQQATYYNYDLEGNVKTLWQQLNGLGLKKVDYEYDLVSGKVNFVRYQDGQADKFYYQYKYDADNRITEAWTGTSIVSDFIGRSTLMPDNKRKDAQYFYYLHGPLARVELGDECFGLVQGIDYAYTLQGWLKGVNGTSMQPEFDIGNDGFAQSGNKNQSIPVDAFGYTLNYKNNDYSPIWGDPVFASASVAPNFKQLYNGNIAASTVNIPLAGEPLLNVYNYDQLNRLTVKNTFNNFDAGSNSWSSLSSNNAAYKESFVYDANGNIKNLIRNGNNANGIAMDNLTYGYNMTGGKLVNNRLRHVKDAVADADNYTDDLKNQPDDNYTYDAIGNLTHDQQAGINNIEWTVYGKIKAIHKSSGDIYYNYDAAGHRISKLVNGTTTYYVRDAQGNTMALYDDQDGEIHWREQHLYGSSRLGIWTPNYNIDSGEGSGTEQWKILGHKFYELDNHLGNVMATITDRVVPHYTSGGTFDYNNADVANANDYYAFGGLMPGRNYKANNTAYRYGFNGKENDNEVKKDINGNNVEGGQQDYGMRIYDPRVGRFLSEDPLTKEYPWYTPYSFAGNKPIRYIDRDGEEEQEGYFPEQRIAEYEGRLRKEDPKHAEQIIRQHNINAFLVVGGAFTAGSGGLAAAFWDMVMLGGAARTTQGIINKNKTQTTEGIHVMAGAAMGEIAGAVIGRIIRSGAPVILDFFGGETSNIKGAINIDPRATSGYKGTIEDFVQLAKANKITGKVDKIVANNPYGYADYLADAAQLLKKGGTITVRGSESNKFFNQILKGTAKGLNEFEVVQGQTLVSDALKKGMKTTSDKPIQGDIFEVTLKRK